MSKINHQKMHEQHSELLIMGRDTKFTNKWH
jgi:hypothetical protein